MRALRERRRNAPSELSESEVSVLVGTSGRLRNLQNTVPTIAPNASRHDLDLSRSGSYNQTWVRASIQFQKIFSDNVFGFECGVCDRLWFQRDLKSIDAGVASFLGEYFPGENPAQFELCVNCFKVCKGLKIPNLSRSNGYRYPPKPVGLPDLDPLTERLISPRIPFMQIRRLRREGSYGILGQVMNIPVDVDTMVKSLPRSLDDDQAFNVNLKKNIVH